MFHVKRWYECPGWFNWHDVYDRAVHIFPSGSHFVEVGCWKGRSVAYLCESISRSGKQIQVTCVDTWEGSEEHKGRDLSGLFDEFKSNLEGYYINIRRLPSVKAASEFIDGTLDFVFLDAAHDKDSVTADIVAWKPKLKYGTGILAGDDISEFPGVSEALISLGYATPERPLVLGQSRQPAWIICPKGMEEMWATPKP